LAASTLRDILAGGFGYKPSESRGALISKLMSALYGVLGFALVFLIMQLGGVLQVEQIQKIVFKYNELIITLGCYQF
jgi:hypothetical protein